MEQQSATAAVGKLSKDLLVAAKTLTDNEARFMVDAYYQMQDDRIRAAARARELSKSGQPSELSNWLSSQSMTLEKEIKKCLDKYTEGHKMGSWMREVHGIGPVLAAGLLANISMRHWSCVKDKDKCKEGSPCTVSCGHKVTETAGQIWRYAGLDPTSKWEKGQKRPWNASLKKLCYLIGQSFVKQSGNPKCFYGHLYLERKEYEIKRNESGGNKAQAEIQKARVGKETATYKAAMEGKLSDAQLVARARRWAVKMFLSHLHAEWYRREFNKEPPAPFAMAILGHAHMIQPPN